MTTEKRWKKNRITNNKSEKYILSHLNFPFHFPIPHFSFSNSHFPFPIFHCPLPILHSPFPTPIPDSHCPLPIAHCPLPIAHCPLLIAHDLLLIAHCAFFISRPQFPVPSSSALHSTFNPLTPKISLVILLTVCQTILIMSVWKIWIN